MKVVINGRLGSLRISTQAMDWLCERNHAGALAIVARIDRLADIAWVREYSSWSILDLSRHDPLLVECVATLGRAANGDGSAAMIIDIPDGVHYEIIQQEGLEVIEEVHRSWRDLPPPKD